MCCSQTVLVLRLRNYLQRDSMEQENQTKYCILDTEM